MKKEQLKEVPKVWGKEIWIVNCSQYCGKFLHLDKGAESSYHRHLKKQETFYCLEGQVALTVNDKSYMLNPYSRPKTIEPNDWHSFRGITDAVILEISTHHDDNDVERVTQSKKGTELRTPKGDLEKELKDPEFARLYYRELAKTEKAIQKAKQKSD